MDEAKKLAAAVLAARASGRCISEAYRIAAQRAGAPVSAVVDAYLLEVHLPRLTRIRLRLRRATP